MALILQQDRNTLMLTLEKNLPAVDDEELSNIFSLMLALLYDYKELEECTHALLAKSKEIQVLHQRLLALGLDEGCLSSLYLQ